MGGKSSSSVFTLRNIIVLVVLVQGLRMLATNNEEVSTLIHEVEDYVGPKGVQQQLAGFQGLRKSPANSDEKGVFNAGEEAGNNRETDAPDDDRNSDADAEGVTEQPDEKAGESSADLNPIVLDKKGTGPTSVGYVKDFVDERKNPAYRNLEAPVTDASPVVAKLINEKSVVPCHDETSGSSNPRCLDNDTPLIAYNSENFGRTWCGQEIKPKSAAMMNEHCTDPIAHLFPVEVPPITGDHMPPIIIKSAMDNTPQEGDLENIQCDIPCQQEKGMKLGQKKWFIDGEPWKINFSGSTDRIEYMKDEYFSTKSLLSSVPQSTFDSKIHSVLNRPMVDFDTAEEKAIYLVSDKCSTHMTKRNRWFDAVAGKVAVDSYGSCGHNIEVPGGMTIATAEGRIALSKRYRMVLAFDVTNEKDNINDVVFEAFVSGAVPVVVGANNLRDRLPPNSFINVNDFQKWDELADYVKKVMTDKELWLSFHKWRDDEEAVAAYESQYEFTNTDPTCRVCRWAYAKKYGLGWDHRKQEVRSIPKVPKEQFCVTADHGLVSKPFSEQWVTKESGGDVEKVLEEDSEGESCSSLKTDGDVSVGSFKGHRKVFQHDGVSDFVITEWTDGAADAETILRLNFPGVRNPDGACFYNTHALVSTLKGTRVSSASIMDDLVKVTVLTNWDTTVKSTGEGIMEVSIKNNGKSKFNSGELAPRRVRVIIEEVSYIHDKMTEFYPSSYCRLMTEDFIYPMGIFIADS